MRLTDAIPAVCAVLILAGCFLYFRAGRNTAAPPARPSGAVSVQGSAASDAQEIAKLSVAADGLLTLVASLDPEQDAAALADAHHLRGLTLFSLGVRTNTLEPIEEAAAAHRAALEFYTEERRRNPQGPALYSRREILLQQGGVLAVLAGATDNPALFQESLDAYREAAALYAEETEAIPRAQAYEGAGNMLSALSRSDDDPAARLREAEQSYRAAAEAYSEYDEASRRRCREQARAVLGQLERHEAGRP